MDAMKGGAMSGRTANLVALVAALLLLSHWISLRGVYLGNPYADAIPAVVALGGLILALFPSKFPGVAWRLIAATWLAVAIAVTTLITLAHVFPCRQNCRGDESDIFWVAMSSFGVGLEAFVISCVIGASATFAFMRSRERRAT